MEFSEQLRPKDRISDKLYGLSRGRTDSGKEHRDSLILKEGEDNKLRLTKVEADVSNSRRRNSEDRKVGELTSKDAGEQECTIRESFFVLIVRALSTLREARNVGSRDQEDRLCEPSSRGNFNVLKD